jgi:hypothetical protein
MYHSLSPMSAGWLVIVCLSLSKILFAGFSVLRGVFASKSLEIAVVVRARKLVDIG